MPSPFSEARCRELHAAGRDREAASDAIRWLSPQILRYLATLHHDPDDARDAFSLWAEHLWKGLPAFRWESSLRAWAYRLAWNAAAKVRDAAWRRRGRRLRTTEASALADELHRSSLAALEDRASKVARLREGLEPEERTLLTLRLDRELSWQECAGILAAEGGAPVPEATLRKRYERIKEKLGRRAREDGLLD